MRTLALLLLFVAVVPGCGNGNIGSLFSLFPPEAFDPNPPGDDDIPAIPGGFEPSEVGFIESAQGVTGDVRNIAIAVVGAATYAFLSAQTGGIHVVDVTEPERVNSRYVTGIGPTLLQGGRCDAITVVDNTYVVCVAVGTAAVDAVTVFHIPTILDRAANGGAVADALVPKLGGPDIAVPGETGRGGGVSGRASSFAVATGGPELAVGVIAPGTPGTWVALAPFTSAANPKVDNFLDVNFTLNGVFASVKSDEVFGIVALLINAAATPPTITPVTPAPVDMEQPTSTNANIDNVLVRDVVGPGNYPLDLVFDTFSLFVTGDREVRIFDATNPALTTPPTIVPGMLVDTISVDSSTGFFATGQSTRVEVFSVLTGQSQRIARFDFSGINIRVRGVKLISSRFGRFILCCAGERGLRVVQWSDQS